MNRNLVRSVGSVGSDLAWFRPGWLRTRKRWDSFVAVAGDCTIGLGRMIFLCRCSWERLDGLWKSDPSVGINVKDQLIVIRCKLVKRLIFYFLFLFFSLAGVGDGCKNAVASFEIILWLIDLVGVGFILWGKKLNHLRGFDSLWIFSFSICGWPLNTGFWHGIGCIVAEIFCMSCIAVMRVDLSFRLTIAHYGCWNGGDDLIENRLFMDLACKDTQSPFLLYIFFSLISSREVNPREFLT